MPGPDLSDAQATVEDLMDDECLIVRNEQHSEDDVFNDETGELEPPDPQTTEVYSGKCYFRLESSERVEEGDAVFNLHTYRLSVPIEVVGVEIGDLVQVTSSLRDPEATELPLGRVNKSPEYKTFAVKRTISYQVKVRIDDRF